MTHTRREFLAASLATGAALALQPAAKAAAASSPPVCAFSKHLQFIEDYAELARAAKDLGLDGLDLTVRPGGHVLPENVATDLPRAVEAIRAEGLDVPMITTRLNDAADPEARPILQAASALGIKYVRVGGLSYSDDGVILSELDGFTEQMRALTSLLEEFDMTAGYHNHSGGTNVGAVLWDLHEVIRAVNSDHFGSNFDIGHAAVEGAYAAWRINTRLLAPYVKMMAVKDFVWDGDRPRWVPLGEGVVQTVEFLKILRAADFAGPVSIHFEYKTESEDVLLEHIGAATTLMRENLRDAGFGS
ncbi:MAG: hypothetical protein AMXMBFR82_08270 [Candidatus Hydrogenedentota bacterium]